MLVAPRVFWVSHVLCEAGLLDAPVGGGPPASHTCCVLLLVAPLVFRAPSGPAAREIATREPKGSEWSISKPARAFRTLRHPPHRRCLCCWCVAWCVVSMPGQALPPPTGAAARPSAALRRRGLVLWSLRRPTHRWRWGFCAMRSPLTACRRRVGALDGVIPPFGGCGATSRGVWPPNCRPIG